MIDWSSDVCSVDLYRHLDKLLRAAFPARAGGAWLDASRDPSDGARREPQGRGRGTARVSRDAGPWRTGSRDTAACRSDRRLETGGSRILGQRGARNCAPEPLGVDLLPDAGLRRLDVVERGRRAPARHRLRFHDRPALLARRGARPLGRHVAHLLRFPGAYLRRQVMDYAIDRLAARSEEHTSELQSLMRISYAVFCLKKKTQLPALSHTLLYILSSHTSYLHYIILISF